MKKRLCSILLVLCLVMTMLPTMALAAGEGTQEDPWDVSAEGEGNDVKAYLKQNNSDNENPTYTLVFFGTGDMANLVTLNENLGVRQNNQPWESAAHQITKLVLDEGVTSIGDGAFYDMPLLKSAEIPASVTKIGVRAFNWAETMDSLTFAKGSQLKEIGYAAFNATAISEITIPASVEKIDKQAFGNDSSLTTVLFEQGSALKEIEENAFFKCGKLTKLILPEGLTTIGNRAFNNENTSLAAVVIPSTVTRFGEEIYNTQNGCLYFVSDEVYNRYPKPQIMNYFMAVTNGGTFAPNSTFTAGVLSEPNKSGFKFAGWYEDADFGGEPVTSAVAGKTYYAKWEEKVEQSAPTAPTLKDCGYTSITLETIEGAQYRCNGGAWQTSPEFTGLTAGTVYTFEARYPETENYKASPVSDAVEFSTLYYVAPAVPSNSVSAPSVPNGTVTVSPANAAKGVTVTVTTKPNEGYELGGLTVTDANGNALALTDLGNGKYSFVMPGSKVSVEASFVKTAVSTGFADVPADAYFADAVKWAVDKGITNGLTDSLFGPYEPCTRAQIVTFLWRAAGSPEPKTAVSFADVPASAYYAKAVAWAIENGITNGMTETTFAPDATCTRGQSVTFLYRALKGSAGSGASFGDVASGAFYADAVNWAVANNVTNGTSDTMFSPDASCTRGQIVTFLYRAYQGK